MKYEIAPFGKSIEILDFGLGSGVIVSKRPSRTGRTEIINVLCELLGGQRASEDSRPNRNIPWKTSASVQAYDDAGKVDYHALRYERGRGLESSIGDLPDSSVSVLGYSARDKCGWYHSGSYLSIRSKHTEDWSTLSQALGLLACTTDGAYRDVLNECLEAAGMPVLSGGQCLKHELYTAEFSNGKAFVDAALLTSTERSGVLQVCSQVIPWLLHTRHCSMLRVEALETCYCLIDDLVPGVDLHAVMAVMMRRFPKTRFLTLAFQ